ncbi:glyceraldehyde 3-phosphate reductase [Anaerocolumna cellulosilytica]|uniref:Glyceraldehyde 3-phosphate reductase n=1 Tax=Anaerocolumna cellulosilytica TaxID=433286 RepID=A0A6S6R0R9_9FIRM|nr:L-glyceraldehyde 3-phosphate reductase [Anaerocolumna cellulosilytica]MBB5198028.1 L-glyceraldehyde 3-phosphate reductase [Anaerocolumna cellulosilytica]BCJ93142.1 glyceraldehyde 3-phosphate reductase [Anaerocolumna cellulosilytica]
MYQANEKRYETMVYNRCGNSGLKLSAFSLGLWHNFGSANIYDNMVDLVTTAFDNGITHFDLANNYGPKPGSAEENFGRILKNELKAYRDEIIISSKAGYYMWPGPYGDWGSKKYLVSSLDQSLKRLGVDYVDIFYHHRPDTDTPLEETMMALDQIVRSGKALYVGVSNYSAEQTEKAAKILKDLGTPLLIHQPNYSMFNRWVEKDLLQVLEKNGVGSIAFCPLAQGLLTNKYLQGVPSDSRAADPRSPFLKTDSITMEKVEKVRKLDVLAKERGQSMAQLALAWVLRKNRITTALIGASKSSQILENIETLKNLSLSEDELDTIEEILRD